MLSPARSTASRTMPIRSWRPGTSCAHGQRSVGFGGTGVRRQRGDHHRPQLHRGHQGGLRRNPDVLCGFAPGETVKITYRTGLSSPNPSSATVCTAASAADGTFACRGTVPASSAPCGPVLTGSSDPSRKRPEGLGPNAPAGAILPLRLRWWLSGCSLFRWRNTPPERDVQPSEADGSGQPPSEHFAALERTHFSASTMWLPADEHFARADELVPRTACRRFGGDRPC